MRRYDDDQSYEDGWDENDSAADEYGGYGYDDSDDSGDDEMDEELHSEHNFRIAMNVFDLISMLVGLAVILALAALLFGLFNWVQRDLSQSLYVITAPFR
jgi:hypothetical protein